jgi:uncharacterized protein with HEPN domain
LVTQAGQAGLQRCLQAAAEARAAAAALDRAAEGEAGQADRRLYRALQNALGEVADAVAELPPALAARHPEVDWSGWAGLREVLAHQYLRLALPRLRPTILDELPLLVRALEAECAVARTAERTRGAP